ncbi:hypothetical protein EV360DRAFT_86494 [Lentinula raphanica]|nr:hypothetical protein EV360DRAFT_86494 [Lentinula raphanica]
MTSYVCSSPTSWVPRHSDRRMQSLRTFVSIATIFALFASAVTEYMQRQTLSFVFAMIAIMLSAVIVILESMTDHQAERSSTLLPFAHTPETYPLEEISENISAVGRAPTNGAGEAEGETSSSRGENISRGVGSSGGELRIDTLAAASTSSNSENRPATVPDPQQISTSSSQVRPSAGVNGNRHRSASWSPQTSSPPLAASTSSNSENRPAIVSGSQRTSTSSSSAKPSAEVNGNSLRSASWSPSLPHLAASTSSISENKPAIKPDRRRTFTSRWPGKASAGVDRRNSARNASWSRLAQTSDLPWLGNDISRAGLRQRIRTRSPESYAYAVEETGQESNRGGRRRTGSKRS